MTKAYSLFIKKPVSMNEDNNNLKNDSYNKLGFFFFLITVCFSSLWAIYFLFYDNKIDLAEGSSDAFQEESAPEGLTVEETERPWITTAQLITHGNKIYQAQCALCHGPKGLGDGTPGLVPPPRNLVEGKWTLGGTPQALFKTLQEGIEGGSMVSFKHLPKLDRWALVHYIRSITENQVAFNEQELEGFGKQAL